MDASIPLRPSGQRVPSTSRNLNDLGHAGSIAMRAAATTASALLMIASAGFGCAFAFTQGAHHGPALAACAVAMALGLELAKPFAIEGVFSCLRSWAIGRALAMAALGLVAVAYSLTAELSLMAATRGDAAAERTKASDSAKDDRAELARLTAERSAMPAFTPATAETVTAARDAVTLAATVRAAECGKRGPLCRQREGDEAGARAALAKAISDKAATDRAAKIDSDAATVRARLAKAAPVAATADPGAAALSALMATFGVTVPTTLVAQWLTLVGVVALELGSALAVVLVRATSPSGMRSVIDVSADSRVEARPHRRERPSAEPGHGRPDSEASKPGPKRTPAATPRTASRTTRGQRLGPSGKLSGQPMPQRRSPDVAGLIVDAIADSGGRIEAGSVRGIAALIGAKRTAVHGALTALLAAGAVAKVGTGLVLTTAGA